MAQITFENVRISSHARKRMRQRAITEEDIRYVLRHGTRIRRAGVLHIVLRWKDIPGQDRCLERIRRLEGTTVIINTKQTPPYITTAYRNRFSTRAIRRKTKTDLKKFYKVLSTSPQTTSQGGNREPMAR
jgi:hypothetical protein